MQPKYPESLLLVWRIAAIEAQQQNSPLIEPSHLLLGLLKVVDLDLPKISATIAPDNDTVLEELIREVRRLRHVFVEAQVNARQFRRALRARLTFNLVSFPKGKTGLHRSKESKAVFAEAEQWSGVIKTSVYPAILLYALLVSNDCARDQVMEEIGIDAGRLMRASKQEALLYTRAIYPLDEFKTEHRN